MLTAGQTPRRESLPPYCIQKGMPAQEFGTQIEYDCVKSAFRCRRYGIAASLPSAAVASREAAARPGGSHQDYQRIFVDRLTRGLPATPRAGLRATIHEG
jgi:hypothetical protein